MEIKKVKEKYDKNMEIKIISQKNIRKFLLCQDIEFIEQIYNLHRLNVLNEDFEISDVITFVNEYTTFLATKSIPIPDTSFYRIKVKDKIKLNQLDNMKDYILNLLLASEKIDKYLDFINSEGGDISKYDAVKNFIIDISKKYTGILLYNKLLERIMPGGNFDCQRKIMEAIVVNILIKCGIFEKE